MQKVLNKKQEYANKIEIESRKKKCGVESKQKTQGKEMHVHIDLLIHFL